MNVETAVQQFESSKSMLARALREERARIDAMLRQLGQPDRPTDATADATGAQAAQAENGRKPRRRPGIQPSIVALIQRGWRDGAIARRVGCHPSTVNRVRNHGSTAK